MLAALLPYATRTIFTRNSNPRAVAPELLAEIATRLGYESPEAPLKAPGKIPEAPLKAPGKMEVVEPLAEAIEAGRRAAGEHGVVVVTGSLSTAGEARTLLVGPVE